MNVAQHLARVTVADLESPDSLVPEARRPETWDRAQVDAVLTLASRWAAEPDRVFPYTAFRRFVDDGDRQEYETHYFRRRKKLLVLGLAAASRRGTPFVQDLENLVWAVCDEYTWALPAHLAGHPEPRTCVDLFAAETASALAELVGLVGDLFHPDTVARVRREVHARVFAPYLADRPPWDWESAHHNWAGVCGGGVGLAALWLLEPADVVKALGRLGPTFDAYLSGFPLDGICLEGMGYWTYGMGYFTAFAEALLDRTGGRCDLWADPDLRPRLQTIARFPSVGRLGRDQFVRFSDGDQGFRYPSGIVDRLASRLGGAPSLAPEWAETVDGDPYARWARHLRNLAWTSRGPRSPGGNGPSAEWFPYSQWLVVRQTRAGIPVGWAAKGGHNGEPHNHNDVGSFQLVVGSEALLDDLGAGRYERDYFGPARYQYFITSSRGHSVPIIGGTGQRPGEAFRCGSSTWETDGERSTLSLDLAPAYGLDSLASLVRTWTFPGAESPVRLTDRFVWTGTPSDVRERWVTLFPARVIDDRSVEVTGTEGRVVIRAETVPEAVVVVDEAFRPHRGPDRVAFCVDFVYDRLPGDAELSFTLTLETWSKP